VCNGGYVRQMGIDAMVIRYEVMNGV